MQWRSSGSSGLFPMRFALVFIPALNANRMSPRSALVCSWLFLLFSFCQPSQSASQSVAFFRNEDEVGSPRWSSKGIKAATAATPFHKLAKQMKAASHRCFCSSVLPPPPDSFFSLLQFFCKKAYYFGANPTYR